MRRLIFSGATAVALSSLALAQGTPAGSETDGQPAATAATSDETGRLTEITVTANRIEQNIQRTAVPIEAFSAGDITRAGVIQPEDLSSIATGVNVSTGGNYPQIYIRGVGNYASTTYAEAAIATNVDDIYVSRPWAVRGEYFDLQRIEVLKGPQGTLYGRNASGGAINLITARPQLGKTDGYVEGDAGNYHLFDNTAAVNLALSNTVAVRVAGNVVRRDGYLTTEGTDDQKSQSGRIHLLYEPGPDLSLLLTGFIDDEADRGAGQTLRPWLGGTDPLVTKVTLANTEPPGFLLLTPQNDSFDRVRVDGVSAEMTWNFGPAALTIIPAYSYADHSDRYYVATYGITEYENDAQTSVEIRLSNRSHAFRWVLGSYFFNENQANQPGQDLLIADAGISAERVPTFSSNSRSYAGFGQATYSITEKFRVTGGIRYTHEGKSQEGRAHSYGSSPCSPGELLAIDSPSPFLSCELPVPLSGTVSFNNVSWKAGLEYDVAPNSLAYASVSTGFKSGGFYAAPPPNTFKPEKVTALELGSKNRFMDNQLQLNLEAFYWRYLDHQESYLGPTSIPGYFTFIVANAGRAESAGGELDVEYQPTPVDHFVIGAQYDHTKYNSYTFSYPTEYFGPPATGCAVSGIFSPANPFQTINCAGFQLVRTPSWTGHVGYSHTFGLSNGGAITPGVRAQLSSGYYTAIDFLPGEYQAGFALLDADLTYTPQEGNWSVALWGRNLTNHAIFTQMFRSPFVNNALAGPGGLIEGAIRPPRTFGLQFHVDF